ncbi:MAG: hypothetical protein Q8R24_00350 [Legionellaceae bacterium]|nr:hypothetical protein [Legionellaceae bacterium]
MLFLIFHLLLLLTKKYVTNFFIDKNAIAATHQLAEDLLCINAISLVPDAVRQISGGLLRGWGDIFYPTLASLLIMSVIGIPLGVIVGDFQGKQEYSSPIFVLRAITITLAAIVNYVYLRQHQNNVAQPQESNIQLVSIDIETQNTSKSTEKGKEVESTEKSPLLPSSPNKRGSSAFYQPARIEHNDDKTSIDSSWSFASNICTIS